MGLLKVLGLDWKILIAQFVNFAVLLFVLYRFAYKPMFKFLDDRKNKIEAGIENFVLAEKRLAEIAEEEKTILKKAKAEAFLILENAKKEGAENKKLIIDKAREEVGAIINKEKESIRLEKAEVLKEMRSEVAGLVVATVEKVIEEKMSGAKDEELIKKILAKLK
jgi:F-type H+-transporting ATPase subunit b